MTPGKSKDIKKSNNMDEIKKAWEELEALVPRVAGEQKPFRIKLLKEIFKASLKLAKESPGTLNLKIAATALKELRFSFKMFYPHRFSPKITIFGSARVPPKSPLYKLAKRFAAQAAKRDYLIMTGGGPGIMAAGNEGAKAKGGFGLNILLPMEQTANPFVDSENMLVHYKYFFTRKLFMVKEAAAFAFFPGGFGTFDEAFEVLTLLQSGKTNLIPVVMLEPEGFGYWKSLSKLLEKSLLKNGFISPADKYLFHVFNDPAKALDHIGHFYKNYHSMRFVRDKLVIRLKQPLSNDLLGKIDRKFASIKKGGKFVMSPPLEAEQNEPELDNLPRLVFSFTRRDFGTLRCLVDFINENTL